MPTRPFAGSLCSENDREMIQRLESDLFFARRAIVGLMSPAAKDILKRYNTCASLEDLCNWADAAAKELVALCDARASEVMGDGPDKSPRSMCPLCGEGSATASGVRGFAVPVGLTRHLLGAHNSGQCVVFGAAYELGRSLIEPGN